MRKRVIICIGCILLVVSVVVGIYTQFIKPVDCNIKAIKCFTWDAVYPSLESIHERYQNGNLNEKEQELYAYDGTLPSKNAKDYMELHYEIAITNRSLVNDYYVNAFVYRIDKYPERVLYGYNSDQLLPGHIFKRSSGVVELILTAYIADMTDEQIEEMATSVQVRTMAKGQCISKNEQYIAGDSCNKINIDHGLGENH